MSDSAGENTNPMDDLAQRRLRGRLAQRAFRQRQIDTIHVLTDENQALKDAIERIANAAAAVRGGVTDFQLHGAIQHARQIAKLDEVGGGGDDDDDDDDHHMDLSSGNSSSNEHSTRDMHSEPLDWRPQSCLPPQDPTPTLQAASSPSQAIANISTLTNQGHMSPRLTYGLLFSPERPIQLIHPPPDIAPYVGAGSTTLAGDLYWSSISYAYSALRLAVHSPQAPVQDPATSSVVSRIFRSVLRYTSPKTMHDLLHARLLFRRQNFLPGDHPAARDPEACMRLLAAIIRFETVEIGNWWAAVDVEAYVRRRVLGSADLAGVMSLFVDKGMCFGDGPRWRVDMVQGIVDAYAGGEI